MIVDWMGSSGAAIAAFGSSGRGPLSSTIRRTATKLSRKLFGSAISFDGASSGRMSEQVEQQAGKRSKPKAVSQSASIWCIAYAKSS